MTQRIAGVLLDLGETLFHFGKVNIPKLFEAGSRKAYAYLQDRGHSLAEFRKYHRQKLLAIRWRYFKSRITGREFNALDVLERLNTRMGIELTKDETIELADLWYRPLSQCARVEPGTIETLGSLRRLGLKLGLVSNTFIPAEVLDRHLMREKMLDLLPVRVYSCEVGYRKPDPRIFQAALDKADLRAEEAIFVGDSPKADVLGANRAGIVSVLKDPSGRHAHGRIRPCHTIKRLDELTRIVAGYNGGAIPTAAGR